MSDLKFKFSIPDDETLANYISVKGEKGDTAYPEWGNIDGDISDQTDLMDLISLIPEFSIEVVQTLPTQDISTTTIYLVPKTGSSGDVYNEYIYINQTWELVGSTEVDLTNYYTKAETDSAIEDAFVDTYSTSQTKGYSADYINKEFNNADKTIIANDFKCKNLFDKNTMPLTKGLWTGSNGIASNNSGWYVIVPITGGVKYTISKKNSGSPFNLVLASTASKPADGVSYVDANISAGASATQYTFTTSSSAKYLFIGLAGASTLTNEQIAQATEELQVEIGEAKTSYISYKNFDSTAYVLWTNPDPASSFSAGSITLNDSLSNYNYYEVICEEQGNGRCYSTGKIPNGKNCISFYFNQYLHTRQYTNSNGNTMTIGDNSYYASYGSTTVNVANGRNIPYMILGYK